MLIPLRDIVKKHQVRIYGVIHIGAHCGQEYKAYLQQNIKNMLFFEPVKSNYKRLIQVVPNTKHIHTYNVALGNEVGVRSMYVETRNDGQSCSLLEPGTHLKQYPDITFEHQEDVAIIQLDRVDFDRSKFNMINIDVQGFELEVFKGAVKTLPFINIIYTEVNFEEVYKGCVQMHELDEFLLQYGFKRVMLDSTLHGWGDAVYLKQ